jgi:hypothetical protein
VGLVQPDVFGRTPFGIRVLREQLAELSGDVDHYVAVLAENLYAAPQHRKIVDALRNAGSVADAERWAQRGLGIGNPIDKGRLRDVYVDLLLERGVAATDEAFVLRWEAFDGNPTKTNYDDLRRTAERIGDWLGVRDKAVSRLRDAYQAAGDATGFGTDLDRLRDRHKRKTAFIAKLDQADL